MSRSVLTCKLGHEVQQCLSFEEALTGENIQKCRHDHSPSSVVAVKLPLSEPLHTQ